MATNKPVVGVFVGPRHIRKLREQNARFMSSSRYIRYIGLANAGQETSTKLYFFSNKDVPGSMHKIKGTYYDFHEKKWKSGWFRAPHILFDKAVGRDAKTKSIRRRLAARGVLKLNAQHYFSKWDLFRRLSEIKEMRPYLPQTIKGMSMIKLESMLKSSDMIYIKAFVGSCGKRVMRVKKLKDGKYQSSYFRNGKLVEKESNHLTDLMEHIHSFFGKKNVIIQQAIDLPVINHSIVDMRSEVQRNISGKLEITGITVRIGRPHSPIASNTHQMQYYTIDEYCKNHMNYSSEQILALKEKLRGFLITVYRSVERCYGRFGEMGIDFALDKSGKLWLIECNAKSAKVALAKSYGKDVIRKAFQNPLEYTKALLRQKRGH